MWIEYDCGLSPGFVVRVEGGLRFALRLLLSNAQHYAGARMHPGLKQYSTAVVVVIMCSGSTCWLLDKTAMGGWTDSTPESVPCNVVSQHERCAVVHVLVGSVCQSSVAYTCAYLCCMRGAAHNIAGL
jgi:hypothetical protein